MRIVLSTYKNYIASLFLKIIYDDDREVSVRVDNFMRRRLETRLIAMVTKFDVDR